MGDGKEQYPMEPGFYNMDCVEAMKRFPDGFFDLAIVDPPYGDGNSGIGGGTRFGGWFNKYKTVEPVREQVRQIQETGADSRAGQPSENICGGGAHSGEPSKEQAEHGRKNTAKKSLRGTLPQGKSIFRSFSAFHAIKSFGEEITSIYRRRGAFWYGES